MCHCNTFCTFEFKDYSLVNNDISTIPSDIVALVKNAKLFFGFHRDVAKSQLMNKSIKIDIFKKSTAESAFYLNGSSNYRFY